MKKSWKLLTEIKTMKKRILTVVGARPQLVKSAMISHVLNRSEQFEEIYVHTGQHYDQKMSEIFFAEMKLQKPHYNLNIGSGMHGEQTGKMLAALETVMQKEKPQCVLVYGDTNSTLAGALAASKLHIPIAHVEAGLRSFNRKMPEEINRVVTDHLSNLLFAPTELAVMHLQREGINPNSVMNVGDVMYDMFLCFGKLSDQRSTLLSELSLNKKDFILATIHRAENTDEKQRLQAIVDGLCEVSKKLMPVVLPLHPRTKLYLEKYNLLQQVQQSLLTTEPVGLLDMLSLEKNAKLILTDSGGVQKEAYFARVPCVTLRDETEWQELVELGWNRLAPPTSAKLIIAAVEDSLGTIGKVDKFPYGKGDAAEKIHQCLSENL